MTEAERIQQLESQLAATQREFKAADEGWTREQKVHRVTEAAAVRQERRADALHNARQAMERAFNEEGHSHTHTKAAAFDYQQRAEQAEGHLRLLASYGGQVWKHTLAADGALARDSMGVWYPADTGPAAVADGDLEHMIQRILAQQDAQVDEDEQQREQDADEEEGGRYVVELEDGPNILCPQCLHSYPASAHGHLSRQQQEASDGRQ